MELPSAPRDPFSKFTLVPPPKFHRISASASDLVRRVPEKSNPIVHVESDKGSSIGGISFDRKYPLPSQREKPSCLVFSKVDVADINSVDRSRSFNERDLVNKKTLPDKRKQSKLEMIVYSEEKEALSYFKPVSGSSPIKCGNISFENKPFMEIISAFGEVVPLKPAKGFTFYEKDTCSESLTPRKQDLAHSEILPTINVFDYDNSLVSTNEFSHLKTYQDINKNNTHFDSKNKKEPKSKGTASLFVKPIKKHCSIGSGELYVPPVDKSVISASKSMLSLPLKGNSRRKNKKKKPDTCNKSQSVLCRNESSALNDGRPMQRVSSSTDRDNQFRPRESYEQGQKKAYCTLRTADRYPSCETFNRNGTSVSRQGDCSTEVDIRIFNTQRGWESLKTGTMASGTTSLSEDNCYKKNFSPSEKYLRSKSNPNLAKPWSTTSQQGRPSRNYLNDNSNHSGTLSPRTQFPKDKFLRYENPYDTQRPFGNNNEMLSSHKRNNSFSNDKLAAKSFLTDLLTTHISATETSKNTIENGIPLPHNNMHLLHQQKQHQKQQQQQQQKDTCQNVVVKPNRSRIRTSDDRITEQIYGQKTAASPVMKAIAREMQLDQRRNYEIKNEKPSRISQSYCKRGTHAEDFVERDSNPSRLTWVVNEPVSGSNVPSSAFRPYHNTRDRNLTPNVSKEPQNTSPLTPKSFYPCNNLTNSLRDRPGSSMYVVDDPISSSPPPQPFDARHQQQNFTLNSSSFGTEGNNGPLLDPRFGYVNYVDTRLVDPGYGSERSEEGVEEGEEREGEGDDTYSSSSSSDEELNCVHSFVEPPEIHLNVEYLKKIFPFINEDTMFEVTIAKTSRGLGLAVTGGVECDSWMLPGLIRIRKLYPQTPASLCGQLKVNDFLLEANSIQLTGLKSHEALETLRTAGEEVHLIVCRAPAEVVKEMEKAAMGPTDDNHNVDGVTSSSSSSKFLELTGHRQDNHFLSPSSSFSTCGEFAIELRKVSGSLGFTLRKNDDSILGHTIRSLVREPALTDGRLRPGDKLLSVNGQDMSGLSHEDAVKFLRTCSEVVLLKIYRDAVQTPVSPASPTEPEFSKPKALRKEARDMLHSLAFQKQTSPHSYDNLNTDNSATLRRRRLNKNSSPDSKADRWNTLVREAEKDTNFYTNFHNQGENGDISPDALTIASSRSESIASQTSCANSEDKEEPPKNAYSAYPSSSPQFRPVRPNFLDLNGQHNVSSKNNFHFGPQHEEFSAATVSNFNFAS